MQVLGAAQVRKSEPLKATECACPSTAFAQDSFSVAQNRPICFQLQFLQFKKRQTVRQTATGNGSVPS